MNKRLSTFTATVATIAATMIATPGLAGSRYVSRDGNLTIEFGNSCSTTSPSGSYRVQGGVSGDLVATTCERLGGDVSVSRFTDTSGNERCYGQMTQSWGSRVMTIWQVEGAVSGYTCSQVGKKFEIEMNSGEQF